MKIYIKVEHKWGNFGTSVFFSSPSIGYLPPIWHPKKTTPLVLGVSTLKRHSLLNTFKNVIKYDDKFCHCKGVLTKWVTLNHFTSSVSLHSKWSFCPKYVFPVLYGIFWHVNDLTSEWTGWSRDKLIEEKFCKCLYSFEEWGSRMCTFLFLSYQILHIFLRWCQKTKIFLSQEQTFVFVVFTKLSCPLPIQYYVIQDYVYSLHISGKHH